MAGAIVESGSQSLSIGAMTDGGKVKRSGSSLSATKSHLLAYRTDTFLMTSASTWYDLPFNIAAPIKDGFTHSDSTNPEQFTVTDAGKYLIVYDVTGYTSNNNFLSVQAVRMLDDGSEISGSFAVRTRGYHTPTSNMFVADIAAGSVIELQVCSDGANLYVEANAIANTPAPTTRPCAVLVMIRID